MAIDAYYEGGEWFFEGFQIEGPVGIGGECALNEECESAWSPVFGGDFIRAGPNEP